MKLMHPAFVRSDEPQSIGQLWYWFVFEPELLRKFSAKLNRWQTLIWLGKSFVGLLLIYAFILVLRFVLVIWIVQADLPTHYPDLFHRDVWYFWKMSTELNNKINFLFFNDLVKNLTFGLVFSLTLGLTGGLALGFANGLIFSLAIGLVFGLTLGLVGGLAGGLVLSLIFGLASGSASGLAGSLVFGLAGGVVFGLAIGLVFGLKFNLTIGLTAGLGFILSWYFVYLRLPFYWFYVTRGVLNQGLDNNVYLHDAFIWLPIPGLYPRLVQQAVAEPKLGQQFITFLLEYRPLQRNLAAHITHALTAKLWQQHLLDNDCFKPPQNIADAVEKLQPSELWLAALVQLREEWQDIEQQNNFAIKTQQFSAFQQRLDFFLQLTLSESPSWYHYYLPALREWEAAIEEKHQNLQQQLQILEPITTNLYLTGTALHPKRNRNFFMGRTDLLNQLSNCLLTAQEMPLLLIHGQHSVGKTSLLNFLPELLSINLIGIVIKQDLQATTYTSIPMWLTDLYQQFNHHLDLENPADWQAGNDWLSAWQHLQNYFDTLSQHEQVKIIFILDEYEQLHKLLQTDPEQSDRLLTAIHSFLQSQNCVVFLLVGATFLSELDNPNWSNYFVQTQTLTVDYLSPADAHRLITEPVKLNYSDSMVNDMIDLTQGHPHLLQALCSKLVDYANRDKRRQMYPDDLNNAVTELLDFSAPVQTAFWNQFCRTSACQHTVLQLLSGEPANDCEQFRRLKLHGYIVEKEGKWDLRVPLFKRWVEMHYS